MPRRLIDSSLGARLSIVIGCAALVAITDTPAHAFSCSSAPWESDYAAIGSVGWAKDVPVDVVLWEMRSCFNGLSLPSGCRLEAGDVTIPLEIDALTDGCDVAYEDREGDNYPDAIIHYTPAQTLEPGKTYTLQCDAEGPRSEDSLPLEVQVRDSDAPAAAPGSLADAELELKRDDDSCCGESEYIAVSLDGDAPYLDEGGYIEARYVNGQVVATSVTDYSGQAWLPSTREALELTPVAANGVRGETVRFGRGDIDRELLYIPCAVSEHASPLALWLLAPLAWIRLQNRRRRGTRGGA